MANFDDIFNSQPKEGTEGQSFASFDNKRSNETR